jgi:regulator of extracellular matrix RemA (YlzA/DUF370 family)
MNEMRLMNIGFGNYVAVGRIIAILSPESTPIKRIISDARDKSLLIDATCGRRKRAAIVTDNGSVTLSALQPETLAGRIAGKRDQESGERVDE